MSDKNRWSDPLVELTKRVDELANAIRELQVAVKDLYDDRPDERWSPRHEV